MQAGITGERSCSDPISTILLMEDLQAQAWVPEAALDTMGQCLLTEDQLGGLSKHPSLF